MSEESDWTRREFESPDGQHRLTLVWESEIRFGPAFYRATLDGQELPGRAFGSECSWSPDSRHLGLELWNSTSEREGPDTSLFLIRVHDLHYSDRPRVRRGFVAGIRFDGGRVLYAKDHSATLGTLEEFEMSLEAIRDWKPLHP